MKSRKSVFVFVFLICQSVQFLVFAQHDYIRFRRLTINDGLSLSSVYTIFQDSKGFMWFGTEDGLNKYDGKKFKIFRPNSENHQSLSYKWIEIIYEDHYGDLWFGSKGGLSRFNPEKEIFQRYGSKSDTLQLLGDTITYIIEGSNEKLWVGTLSGINMIDLQSKKVEFSGLKGLQVNSITEVGGSIWICTQQGLYTNANDSNSIKKVLIGKVDEINQASYSLAQDADGALWTGIGDKLFRCENRKNSSERNWVFMPTGNRNQNDQIENMLFDPDNNLWIACTNGLYRYDAIHKTLESVVKAIDTSHSLAINPNKSLHLDKSGDLWYGTFGEGIYRIDVNSGRVVNFRNNPGDIQSLSENTINSIFEDQCGNIWIGTFGAGINIYQPGSHKFGYMSHQPLNSNSLSSSFIWSIMECDNEWIWVGTNDAGLNIYDPVTNHFQHFNHEPGNPSSIAHSSVRKVFEDSKKRIWIGTDGGGLNRYYPNDGRFEAFKTIPGDESSLSGNSVRTIYEDRDGRLWVGTRNGLNLFNPDLGTFRRFVHDPQDESSISNNFVYSAILQGDKGDLWVGTYGGGLNRMDMTTGKFQRFLHTEEDPDGLSDNIVFSIYQQEDGTFWIGTNSGLNRFDVSTGKFKRFGILEGLPNEVIYGILADEKNNLWLSTNKGICRFNLDNYSSKNFTINDGLQSNEFNGGAFYKGKSGRMYFGGVYGLNIIDPEFSYFDYNTAQVVITSLEILGNEVIANSELPISDHEPRVINVDNQYYMPTNISYADEIILDYEHRFFSIEYAALNSKNTDNLQFQFVLEGLDDNWNDVGGRNFITFANMQPGEYNLKVRSVNADGFEGLSSAQLKITIIPPFWKTWWFYFLEFALLIVLLVFIYKYLLKIRTNRLLIVQNEKIFQANEKLKDSENNLKQLNATKDKFFSIISHDLKNPFTSLLSISELMSDDYQNLEEEEREQGIKRVHDSAKRIYKLLENLLTWSRAQSGRIHFTPENVDLVDVIQENVSLHEEFAINKCIGIRVEIPKNIKVNCDREMMNTVLRNLINNAIKFSPSGKPIVIEAKDLTTAWKISIIDEGVGISSENQQKVFRIDTKFKTEGTCGEKGTGLGLIICKEFVDKNGGEISITSAEGQGSTFSFTIPKFGSFVE